MSFTFHYCKKISGTQMGPPHHWFAFLNSSPLPEMRRFPKSLVCQDGETVNVRNRTALHFRQKRIQKLRSTSGSQVSPHRAAPQSPKQGLFKES